VANTRENQQPASSHGLAEQEEKSIKKQDAMTKDELSTQLAAKTGMSKSQALRAVEGVMDVMKQSLIKGENIYLRRFGTFKVIHREEKKARLISEGKTVMVPAHQTVKFISGKELKNAL